jgi:hypothetical protein
LEDVVRLLRVVEVQIHSRGTAQNVPIGRSQLRRDGHGSLRFAFVAVRHVSEGQIDPRQRIVWVLVQVSAEWTDLDAGMTRRIGIQPP